MFNEVVGLIKKRDNMSSKDLISKFEAKEVEVSLLKDWDINPRIHTDKGLSDVGKSISAYGLASFIICDSDYTIVGGHARVKVLKELGKKTAMCWVAKEKLSKKDFRKSALLSNSIRGAFDNEKLNSLKNPFELLEIGFESHEVDFGMDDIEIDDEEMEVSSERNKDIRLILRFKNEREKLKFEMFMIKLNDMYTDIDLISERIIKYIKDNI